ncbi:MAG: hypothetical protein DI586_00395 [Micavibrio aeruginosavorus]|uniref:Cytochrome c assembly protein domain-containing protein n=1 Tax=Micavibrio aeruginosavorus TaxID=349221 RepID=A0A2W5FSG4_9BACT|nr:MAG: hypothetical protein DI586_00395 [Micavibrio aeruginosavorus]
MIRIAALILFILFIATPAIADSLAMRNFRQIPILHEGRIKPFDSFARVSLKFLSEKESTPTQNASEWLAEMLFAPAKAIDNPVFNVESDYLRHRLGLEERKHPLYSFYEIMPGLKKTTTTVQALIKKDKSQLSRDEKDLLDIHDRAAFYASLLRSLSLILPLDISLPDQYRTNNDKELSYIDLARLQQNLSADVKNIIARKGQDISRYTAEERKTALLSFQLDIISSAARDNSILKIIPPQWESDNGDWHAPWEILQKGEGSPESAKLILLWRDMGDAYMKQDQSKWLSTSQAASAALESNVSTKKIKAELLQNDFPPFKISTGFYIAAFILILCFFAFGRIYLYSASLAALLIGLLVQAGGIGLRVWLLSRPPVGTLYESMLFVSLVTVAIALLFERLEKKGTGLLAGSFTGLLIALLSFSFAGEGDTMTMLGAVLNTNFWLATHVLCITMGYGWCLLASFFAHLAMIPKNISSRFEPRAIDQTLSLLVLFSLLFTAIGTILGGIWADQSWGRFWGWDPKENGALLIVLWLIWLMHGKIGFQLSRLQYLAGLAFLSVIVAISWVGVNLLGVGLHSYGFAEGYFYGLAGFTCFESILIAYLWRQNRKSL